MRTIQSVVGFVCLHKDSIGLVYPHKNFIGLVYLHKYSIDMHMSTNISGSTPQSELFLWALQWPKIDIKKFVRYVISIFSPHAYILFSYLKCCKTKQIDIFIISLTRPSGKDVLTVDYFFNFLILGNAFRTCNTCE